MRRRNYTQTTGNLGKVVELTPKSGEPFSAYVSIDPLTNELVALRADRVSIPKEIKGVELTVQQVQRPSGGKAVKVEGMLSKNKINLLMLLFRSMRRKA